MKPIVIHNRQKGILAGCTALAIAITMAACDHRDTTYYPIDHQAPPVPTGVTSVTMDEAVLILWDPVQMDPSYDDLAAYMVYRSDDNQRFTHIATVDNDVTEYLDDGLVNGRTYYYAVSSIDYDDNESDLSRESVYDTPRPEGFDERIYTFNDPDYMHISGFDLSREIRLPYDDTRCDFYLEYDDTPGIDASFIWLGNNGARMQDMGYTDSFDDITYAPSSGWSVFSYLEIIPGHSYVIQTEDNHYAKVRVTQLLFNPTYGMLFDWGYQIDPGNRELKIESPAERAIDEPNGEGM